MHLDLTAMNLSIQKFRIFIQWRIPQNQQMGDRLGDVCKGLTIEIIQRMSSKQPKKMEKF